MKDGVRGLCLVPYPPTNAGVRLRFEQQLDRLADQGVRLTLSPFLDEAGLAIAFRRGHLLGKALAVARGFGRRLRDLARLRGADVLLVYRESVPFGPRFVESVAARRGVPVLLDFDEALFVPNIHPANRAWAWLRDPQRLAVACRTAAAVTAQNEYLAEYARRWNRTVTVIPTPIDTAARRPRNARAPGPVIIGWLGSETTARYLYLIDDALAEVCAASDVIVRVVGGAYANPRVPRLELQDFALEREQSELDGFDIGLLPEPDDPWTRGKGGYKALLYMAAGIPVVASHVGVNPDIVADGETGYCVSTTDEWIAALRKLIDDAALRDRLGAAGRTRVVERYSIDVIAPRFAKAIRDVARP